MTRVSSARSGCPGRPADLLRLVFLWPFVALSRWTVSWSSAWLILFVYWSYFMLFITNTMKTTTFVGGNNTNRMRRNRGMVASPVPASKHLICGFYIQPGHPIRSSAKESRSAYGGVLSRCGCVMLGTMIIFKPLCWAIKLPEWHTGQSCLHTGLRLQLWCCSDGAGGGGRYGRGGAITKTFMYWKYIATHRTALKLLNEEKIPSVFLQNKRNEVLVLWHSPSELQTYHQTYLPRMLST